MEFSLRLKCQQWSYSAVFLTNIMSLESYALGSWDFYINSYLSKCGKRQRKFDHGKSKTITDISGYLTCRGSQICFVEASSRFMFYSKEMEQNNVTFYNIYGGQSAHPRALLSKQCDNRQLHVLLGEMETCL